MYTDQMLYYRFFSDGCRDSILKHEVSFICVEIQIYKVRQSRY